jgi:hypothetical protein
VACAFDSTLDFAEVVVGLPIVVAKDAADCAADRHHMG